MRRDASAGERVPANSRQRSRSASSPCVWSGLLRLAAGRPRQYWQPPSACAHRRWICPPHHRAWSPPPFDLFSNLCRWAPPPRGNPGDLSQLGIRSGWSHVLGGFGTTSCSKLCCGCCPPFPCLLSREGTLSRQRYWRTAARCRHTAGAALLNKAVRTAIGCRGHFATRFPLSHGPRLPARALNPEAQVHESCLRTLTGRIGPSRPSRDKHQDKRENRFEGPGPVMGSVDRSSSVPGDGACAPSSSILWTVVGVERPLCPMVCWHVGRSSSSPSAGILPPLWNKQSDCASPGPS